ncbi:MAG: prephenate dehydratase [Akkermansia sp.]
MELPELRQNIDCIDAQIIELLKQRFSYVRQIGDLKKENNAPVFVPEREFSLISKLETLNQGSIPKQSLLAIYREIISCGYAQEGNLRIAYLGPPGTWSHIAAIKQFGRSVTLLDTPNFSDIFDMVSRGKAHYGIVPVENSTNGAVTPVLDLFVQSPLKICAQIHLSIKNALMANVPCEQIRTIYSHPQPLGQCSHWILRHFPNAELVETSSTTKAAQLASEQSSQGAAAIGTPLAAELFGLTLLEEDAQDNSNNTTRFAIIGHQESLPTGKDRTSLLFHIHHQPGTLVSALDCFKKHNIDLIRIESRPSKVINWEYVFYVDTLGHAQEEPLRSALKELEQHCSLLKILGSYPQVDLI